MLPSNRARAGLAASLSIFAISRALAFAAGVRFDASPMYYFAQVADLHLLRTRMAETLLYMHGQPPLFNLLIGTVLKLAPGHEQIVFAILWFALGLGVTGALYSLLVRLDVRPPAAALWTTLFVINPTSILYENWLYVTYPIAFLVLLSALALHRFVERRRITDGILFFGVIAIAGLTRSVYQLWWLILVGLGLIVLLKNDRRRITIAAAVPVMVLTAWYAKNAVVVGSFSANTTLGMNMFRATTQYLPRAERESLIRQGRLSPLALQETPFTTVDTLTRFLPRPRPTAIPVLDNDWRPGGYPNYNNLIYARVDEYYTRDAFYVGLHYPLRWLVGFGISSALFTYPGSDYYFVWNNREKIAGYDRMYNAILMGQIAKRGAWASAPDGSLIRVLGKASSLALFLIACLVAAGVYGAVRSVKILRSRSERSLPRGITFLYITSTIYFVSFTSNAFECGENNRFRFEVDPLFAVVLALLAVDLAGHWRTRRAPALPTVSTARDASASPSRHVPEEHRKQT